MARSRCVRAGPRVPRLRPPFLVPPLLTPESTTLRVLPSSLLTRSTCRCKIAPRCSTASGGRSSTTRGIMAGESAAALLRRSRRKTFRSAQRSLSVVCGRLPNPASRAHCPAVPLLPLFFVCSMLQLRRSRALQRQRRPRRRAHRPFASAWPLPERCCGAVSGADTCGRLGLYNCRVCVTTPALTVARCPSHPHVLCHCHSAQS